MKTDNYTKGVLTIIALCLTTLVFQNFDVFPAAHAADENFETKLDPYPNVMDVNIKSIDSYDVLKVSIKDVDTQDNLNVSIRDIDAWGDELDVNIKEIGGSSVSSSSGKMTVKCDN